MFLGTTYKTLNFDRNVYCLCWLAYCSTYFLRKPLGVIKTDLGADLGLSKTQLGWCDLTLTLPYGLVQVSDVTNRKILTEY